VGDVEIRPIDEAATLDLQNTNKHTQRGGGLLENSLRRRGANRSVASAGKGVETPVITAGNYTYEKAVTLGFENVMNVYTDGKTLVNVVRMDVAPGSAEAIALGIEDNEIGKQSYAPDVDLIAQLAAGDSAVLAALYKEDSVFNSMVEGMGVREEAQDAEPEFDRAEELRKKWGVEFGDVWELEKHLLICGDCTEKATIERIMNKEKATLLFTDPPYGVSIGAKNRMLNSFQKAGKNLANLKADDDNADDLGAMLLSAFTLAKEFLADDCSVFVCSPQGGQLGMMMMMMMMNAGLEIRHVLNWIKNSPTFSMGRLDYDYQHEPILFTWTKKHKRIMAGKFKTSTWEIDKPRANKEHPTIKPVGLYENAMLNHTEKNDICFDNFCGSGTMLVACQNLNRRGRVVEISPTYCAVILERMATAFPDLEIKRLK